MTLADDLTTALRSAPDLHMAPSLAVAAAQTQDPHGNAQSLAHAANVQGTQKAYDEHVKTHGPDGLHAALGWLHGVEQQAGKTIGLALHAANAPLQEIQHQYRYLRDVGERHGPVAALASTLAIGTGAALGTIAGGQGILGAEAAAGLLSRVAYRDSWARTEHGEQYTDASSGSKVSFGRDLAHVLHLKEGAWTSGVADGLFDLTLDPLAVLGKAKAAATSAEGASGLLAAKFGGTAINPTSVATGVADVDRVFGQYAGVRRAFGRLAQLEPEQISTEFPKFSQIANRLGAAKTVDAVKDVFRDEAALHELTKTGTAPMMSFTRRAFRGLSDATEGTVGGRLVDRATRPFTLIPQTYDAKTLEWSNVHFDPTTGHQEAAEGIRRAVRMGQSKRVADDVVERWLAAPDLATRADIYGNAMANMIAARAKIAGFDEILGPAELKVIKANIDELTKGAGPGGAIYGFTQEGRNASKVMSDGGAAISAAITDNQTGKWAFPNYVGVKRVAEEMKGHAKIFGTETAPGQFIGKADDFLYDRFTQGVFKKLVLLSGGFALRISAAEGIPAALRNGVMSTIEGTVTKGVGRLSAKADADEIGHIGAAVYALLGRPVKAMAAEDVELGSRLMVANGGHIVHPSVGAGENISGEVGAKAKAEYSMHSARKSMPLQLRKGDEFGEFGQSDKNFVEAWHSVMSEITQDAKTQEAAKAYNAAKAAGATDDAAFANGKKAATDWLDAQPKAHLSNYERHTLRSQDGIDQGLTPHEDWGRVATENMLSATAKHPELLQHVADGTLPPQSLLESIDGIDRPLMVKGRKQLPIVDSKLDRIANLGFKKVLDPIVNFLGREPVYFQEVKNQYAPLKRLIADGTLDEDTALQIAQSRAINHMLPHIHNIGERSQMALTTRNWMPFYFAQTQAYRRVGRLLAEDPGAFRRYQLIFTSLADVGHHESDGNGQKHLIIPGTGFLTSGANKLLSAVGIPTIGSLPIKFSGDLKSLATVSPFLENEPGTGLGTGPFKAHFGPVVGIAAHAITNFMPETAPVVHKITGERQAAGSIYDQFIPNQTLKRVVQALGGTNSVSFQNAMVSSIQALEARGDAPKPDDGPVAQQAFIDRVKNHTRILFLVKAVVGAASPLSPQADIGDVGLQDEFRAEIKKSKNGIGEAVDSFLKKHPDATPYTVFKSEVQANAPLPASEHAQEFINTHKALFDSHPYAAAWLVPQDDKVFSQAVYNEQMAQHLRVRKAPKQMLNDIYAAAGYLKYSEAVKERDAAIAATPAAEKQIRHSFSGYISTVLGPQNPVWWAEFQSPERAQTRQLAITQLRDVFASGKAPNTEQARNVAELIKDHDEYEAAKIVGHSDVASREHNNALKDSWNAYIAKRSAETPSLSAISAKLFEEH